MTAATRAVQSPASDLRMLAEEIRGRLGPTSEIADWPLVSLVVLNRDGAEHLRRLLPGLVVLTDYPSLELVLVDNASTDDSLDFIRTVEAPFPISILPNAQNESFSDACNQGAELAAGELLLFLNNDVEPFEPGWLRELVACLRAANAAAAASTLLCPDREHQRSFRHGYGVAHRGLAFREEEGAIGPVLHGWEADPLDEGLGVDLTRGAVAAACLLVKRRPFEQVGGFSHGYVYGAEDVDLCLKLRSAGHGVLCSGRSIAVHHPVSTRRTAPFEEERTRKLANRRLLLERWGPQLHREYELDRLDGKDEWAAAEGGADGDGGPPPARSRVEALSFCIKAIDPPRGVELDAIAAALERRAHRCLLLEGELAEDSEGLCCDVALHVRGAARYVPKPAQLNVLWDIGGSAALTASERSRYQLVLAGESERPTDEFVDELLGAVERRIPEVGYRRRIEAAGSRGNRSR